MCDKEDRRPDLDIDVQRKHDAKKTRVQRRNTGYVHEKEEEERGTENDIDVQTKYMKQKVECASKKKRKEKTRGT